MNMFTKIRDYIISYIIVLIIGFMGYYVGNMYYGHNESNINYSQEQETVAD